MKISCEKMEIEKMSLSEDQIDKLMENLRIYTLGYVWDNVRRGRAMEDKYELMEEYLYGTRKQRDLLMQSLFATSKKLRKSPIDIVESYLILNKIYDPYDEQIAKDLRELLQEYLNKRNAKLDKVLTPSQQLRPFLTPMEEVNGK